MKISFGEIEEALTDPFFELRCLGKETIRQRTLPLNRFGDVPDNLRMTEWTTEDNRLVIHYSFMDTGIGRLLIASTSKGICFLGFANKGESPVMEDFKRRFPQQPCNEQLDDLQKSAAGYCNGDREQVIPLHLKGTGFQVDVWMKIARIPEGRVATYGSLIPGFKGTQAIGTAVGTNPVSYIVPCHRVVRNDGSYPGYHWGSDLKRLLLAYELQSI